MGRKLEYILATPIVVVYGLSCFFGGVSIAYRLSGLGSWLDERSR